MSASLTLIRSHLHWIPGNGKKIKIWEEKILNKTPLETYDNKVQVQEWLIANRKYMLCDISKWNSNGKWVSWNLGDPPSNLRNQAESLLQDLRGSSLHHLLDSDERGWGDHVYTVASGYDFLLTQGRNPIKFKWAKCIWHPDTPPKINIFNWILL